MGKGSGGNPQGPGPGHRPGHLADMWEMKAASRHFLRTVNEVATNLPERLTH